MLTLPCLLFTAFILFIGRPSYGQWAATYGGADADWAYSVQQTTDGGYIVAGATRSFGAGETDAWVLKLRPDGAIEWQKTYGGVENDCAYSIQQTTDGGYIVAGDTSSFITRDEEIVNLWVFKLGPDGTVEWQKTYGGAGWDEARSVQQTIDGGYIVAGETNSFGAGGEDFWVLKLRPDGTIDWQKTYGGVDCDEANSVQQTIDGGYIVVGRTKSFGAGDYDFWVLKLRPDGTIEWQKTYGGVNCDITNVIRQAIDGGYIVVGGRGSLDVRRDNLPDILVLKLRSDGVVEWQKNYGDSGGNGANCTQQTADGGYIVGGWARGTVRMKTTGSFETDAWVSKLRPDGTVEWQKTYGGVSEDYACSITQTTDGGYVVAGWTYSFGIRRNDVWVLKLNADGSFGYAQDKSINPSCNFTINRSLSCKDSSVTIKTTTVSPVDSHANLQYSSATIQTTNASVNLMCH